MGEPKDLHIGAKNWCATFFFHSFLRGAVLF